MLAAPRGRAVRPTADRVREALFSILADRTPGARVLDLFAGTGALGLEALSRGAVSAVFVEPDSRAFAVLRRNLASLGAERRAETLFTDHRRAVGSLAGRRRRFDLVFLDPPYGRGLGGEGAELLREAGLLEAGAAVVAEEAARGAEEIFPAAWELFVDRRYGDTRIRIFTVPA